MNVYNFLHNVRQQLEINTVYDIGAHSGQWSLDAHRLVLDCEMILFEANPIHNQSLSQTGFKYFNGFALSNPGRESVTFHSAATKTGDSYYKENTKFYDEDETITLPCKTLDDVVAENNLNYPQFIKMDTQGSELDILAGAKNVLKNASLVYVECPIIEYNKGAPGIGDYLKFFKEHNYVPIDIFEVHKAENIILQIDIMFMRNEEKERIFGKNEYIRPL